MEYSIEHGKWSESVSYIFRSTGQQRGSVTEWEDTITFYKQAAVESVAILVVSVKIIIRERTVRA